MGTWTKEAKTTKSLAMKAYWDRKKNRVPLLEDNTLRKNIFERPDFLNSLPSKGGKAMAIAKLSEKMKLCKSTETVVYTFEEMKERFPSKSSLKQDVAYIQSQLRYVYKRAHIRTHIDNESQRVYFWENGIR